jgi:hypothetical protein
VYVCFLVCVCVSPPPPPPYPPGIPSVLPWPTPLAPWPPPSPPRPAPDGWPPATDPLAPLRSSHPMTPSVPSPSSSLPRRSTPTLVPSLIRNPASRPHWKAGPPRHVFQRPCAQFIPCSFLALSRLPFMFPQQCGTLKLAGRPRRALPIKP